MVCKLSVNRYDLHVQIKLQPCRVHVCHWPHMPSAARPKEKTFHGRAVAVSLSVTGTHGQHGVLLCTGCTLGRIDAALLIYSRADNIIQHGNTNKPAKGCTRAMVQACVITRQFLTQLVNLVVSKTMHILDYCGLALSLH